jgi:hypothetical protein
LPYPKPEPAQVIRYSYLWHSDFKEYLRRPVGLDELDLARDESLGREVL